MSVVAFSENRMFFFPVIGICEKCGERITINDMLPELVYDRAYKCSNCSSRHHESELIKQRSCS